MTLKIGQKSVAHIAKSEIAIINLIVLIIMTTTRKVEFPGSFYPPFMPDY